MAPSHMMPSVPSKQLLAWQYKGDKSDAVGPNRYNPDSKLVKTRSMNTNFSLKTDSRDFL